MKAPATAAHAVLERAEANLQAVRRVGFERLVIARDWALLHVTEPPTPGTVRHRPVTLGATGLLVEEYAAAELGVSLELHPLAAQRLMADAVDLADRLPHVWTALEQGQLEDWVARKITAAVRALSRGRALRVDAAIADALHLPPGRLLNLVEARVVEADQELAERTVDEARRERLVRMGRDNEHGVRGLAIRADAADVRQFYATTDHLAHILRDHGAVDETMDQLRARAVGLLASPLLALQVLVGADEHDLPDDVAEAVRAARPSRTRPRAVVYLHLSPEALQGRSVGRAEELGAHTRAQLVELLGHHHVSLRPVIDLEEGLSADCYEVPATIAERIHLVRPADVFPYAESLSRRQDLDHTVAYQPTGPPGQTRVDNLGPMVRRHHRVKTHAVGWSVRQEHGRFIWTTPHDRVLVTDAHGTHRVASRPVARRLDLVWRAA